MSESPERKTLKEVLANLKSKSLSSKGICKQHIAFVLESINETMKMIDEQLEKKPTPRNVTFMRLMKTIQTLLNDVISSSNTTISDMEIYIDALERYSANLDSTLNEIFEQARKHAEEEIKKQEELMKREPPKSMIV